MRKPKQKYGFMHTYKGQGKVHKTGNPWGNHISRCGSAILDKKFNSIKKYSESELCQRCFKGHQLNSIKFKKDLDKVLHMEEELFRL